MAFNKLELIQTLKDMVRGDYEFDASTVTDDTKTIIWLANALAQLSTLTDPHDFTSGASESQKVDAVLATTFNAIGITLTDGTINALLFVMSHGLDAYDSCPQGAGRLSLVPLDSGLASMKDFITKIVWRGKEKFTGFLSREGKGFGFAFHRTIKHLARICATNINYGASPYLTSEGNINVVRSDYKQSSGIEASNNEGASNEPPSKKRRTSTKPVLTLDMQDSDDVRMFYILHPLKGNANLFANEGNAEQKLSILKDFINSKFDIEFADFN